MEQLDVGVVSDPRLHSGEPVLQGTSTTVRAVVELWNHGVPAEEIPVRLPHLELRQIFEALRFYLAHRQQIDDFIAANRIPDQLSGRRFDPETGNVE